MSGVFRGIVQKFESFILNGITGAVTLVAGTNVTLTPSGNTITIASTGGGSGIPPIDTIAVTFFGGA